MTVPPALGQDHDLQRAALARVAAHVLARARFQADGRIGLVATPGGLGTPAFGPDHTVVRLIPAGLVVDRDGTATVTPWGGATLRRLADAADVDLSGELSVGSDTPELGEPDATLPVTGPAVAVLGWWFGIGWQAIDAVVAGLGPDASAARTQLWPEHFDAGTNVAVGPGATERVNLGASAGDALHAEPYLYVGPWGDDRPGDAGYWNAPFGAVLGYREVAAATDPVAAAIAFLRNGTDRFS